MRYGSLTYHGTSSVNYCQNRKTLIPIRKRITKGRKASIDPIRSILLHALLLTLIIGIMLRHMKINVGIKTIKISEYDWWERGQTDVY
jgi:hypothetical protein